MSTVSYLVEAERAFEAVVARARVSVAPVFKIPEGPTEVVATVRVRRMQRFFRTAVLVSYESRCAISRLAIPDLLVASHIIPWSANESRRADPHNGICLNALYDRAFDCGLLTFDDDLCVMISPQLRTASPPPFQVQTLLNIEGQKLTLPERFAPDPVAIAYHRTHVFRSGA